MDSANRNFDLALRLDTHTRNRLTHTPPARARHNHPHRLADNRTQTRITQKQATATTPPLFLRIDQQQEPIGR